MDVNETFSIVVWKPRQKPFTRNPRPKDKIKDIKIMKSQSEFERNLIEYKIPMLLNFFRRSPTQTSIAEIIGQQDL